MTELEKLQDWLRNEIHHCKLLANQSKEEGHQRIQEDYLTQAYTLQKVMYQTYVIEDENEQR